MAKPSTRLTVAVATFCVSGAPVLNGNATATIVASAIIQPKNTCGRGVVSRSRCMIAVATSAAPAADSTYAPVDASPHAPSRCGARIGMVNSHRAIRMPASAIRAATTAVATPPAHRGPGSIQRVGFEGSGGGSSALRIGVVIGTPLLSCTISR